MSHRPFQVPLCRRLYRHEKINLRKVTGVAAQTRDIQRCRRVRRPPWISDCNQNTSPPMNDGHQSCSWPVLFLWQTARIAADVARIRSQTITSRILYTAHEQCVPSFARLLRLPSTNHCLEYRKLVVHRSGSMQRNRWGFQYQRQRRACNDRTIVLHWWMGKYTCPLRSYSTDLDNKYQTTTYAIISIAYFELNHRIRRVASDNNIELNLLSKSTSHADMRYESQFHSATSVHYARTWAYSLPDLLHCVAEISLIWFSVTASIIVHSPIKVSWL